MCHGCAVHLDVLHVLSSNRRRGAETFGYELHQALVERGLRSGIWCLQPANDERQLPVPALASRRFSLAGMLALRRYAASAQVVVAHGSSTLLACGVGLLGSRTPFVYVNIGDPRYWAGSRARRVRTGWLIRRAAAVASISPSARDLLIEYYRLPADRVHIIPNGRDAERFKPVDRFGRSAAREALGLPPDVDIAAVIGALSPEKRVDVAITALAQLEDTMLVVAGDGTERSALEALADRVAPGRVRFLGPTDDPDGVLAAADMLVLSSDSEGVPGVLIEAGLAGLPVVATDVGWVSDVVVPGETGLLVEPGRPDKLATAVRRALDLRGVLGPAGRAHCVARFEMNTVADRWQHLLRAAAGDQNAV